VPPLLAAFVAAECCQALDYAHQRKGPDGVALGIVHRDVTPRNVLLSWSGEVKLTDFGIAALAGEATARLLGTPQYMAPEQARSEPIDPRADIYAVGLLLREALSGVRPRPGADRESILDAARRGILLPWPEIALGSGDHPRGDRTPGDHIPAAPPEPPAQPAPPAPPAPPEPPEPPEPHEPPPAALVAIADRATASAPGDRYPDARSMLEDLDHYIVGERARHKADSPARQLAAWLAVLWENARDDAAADAAIEGDHLVSFLDDGAFDLIGTGTVRSLAATAADDAHAGATPGAAPPGPPTGPALAGSTPSAAVARAPLRAGESGGRATRISSANTTVAAGSFDAVPAHDPGPGTAPPSHRRRRAIVPLAIVALVAVAAAAVVTLASSGRRGSNATAPTTAPPPPAAQPTIERPSTEPSPAQPTAAPANANRPASGQPDTTPSATKRPVSGHLAATSAIAPKSPAPTTTGRSSTAVPSSQRPAASPGTADLAHAPSSAPSDAAKPPTCRVRINFTPWAYYTVDHDPTRHETPGTIDLAPGEHHLRVWNPELHIERDIALTVPADRDTMNFSEPLQPPALRSEPPKP
jgi:hypothetical protein